MQTIRGPYRSDEAARRGARMRRSIFVDAFLEASATEASAAAAARIAPKIQNTYMIPRACTAIRVWPRLTVAAAQYQKHYAPAEFPPRPRTAHVRFIHTRSTYPLTSRWRISWKNCLSTRRFLKKFMYTILAVRVISYNTYVSERTNNPSPPHPYFCHRSRPRHYAFGNLPVTKRTSNQQLCSVAQHAFLVRQ